MGDMGIGQLGDPKIIIKRKFRWTFEINAPLAGPIGPYMVKSVSRPQLDLDETELHFRNAVAWIPGKAKWQPLTVTFVDAVHWNLYALYGWLLNVYNFQRPTDLEQTEKEGWAASATLNMLDGCGTPIERWELEECWPQSVKFGDLEYSDSSECTIEMTLRFNQAHLYVAQGSGKDCELKEPVGACLGCGSSLEDFYGESEF